MNNSKRKKTQQQIGIWHPIKANFLQVSEANSISHERRRTTKPPHKGKSLLIFMSHFVSGGLTGRKEKNLSIHLEYFKRVEVDYHGKN
ncbi:hypothetical protein [Neobacillus sp. OS1-33]|uniref:hypothetical protein n=1 Tax=Neobacillus sp. OS1-33 TaxID=3070683 RepID=UPI0027E10AFE|nr:hypothetical protein [Neobacillus sp. OS1-33]WML26292.1 hypothetical protein RCG22_01200 [Neobacillus sp. OS1-33]